MWPKTQEKVDLVTVTEEILNGKLHFLGSDTQSNHNIQYSIYSNIHNTSGVNPLNVSAAPI